MPESPILVLGKIKEARGLHGHLKLIHRGDILFLPESSSKIKLYSASGIKDGFLSEPSFVKECKLTSLLPVNDEVSDLQLEGIRTREDAEEIAGLFIGMELEEARKKFHDPDDPYLFEYLHCDVVEKNTVIGTVDRVEDFNGKQWLIVIRHQKEFMVPLQGPFIKNFDVASGRVELFENTGLFDYDETT